MCCLSNHLLTEKYCIQTKYEVAFLTFSPNKQWAINAWVNAKKPQPRCGGDSNCSLNRGGPWQFPKVLNCCHRRKACRWVTPNSAPIHQLPASEKHKKQKGCQEMPPNRGHGKLLPTRKWKSLRKPMTLELITHPSCVTTNALGWEGC